MVNGMTVNGLGEVAALSDPTNGTSSLLGLGKQLTHYLILGTNSSLALSAWKFSVKPLLVFRPLSYGSSA